MKNTYVKDIKYKERIESSFMILKIISREGGRIIGFIGDNSGDIKCEIKDKSSILQIGDVISIIGEKDILVRVSEFKKIIKFDIDEYLPCVKRPVADIMSEIEQLTNEEFKSEECLRLNDYFFKDEAFLTKFKKGIGGLNQHHNYRGGLAEHTLNVMYMTKILAYRYNCYHKDIAILAAKLHDIGKTEEYYVDGPFSVTMKGEMEGHIVTGISMLEEAFKAGGNVYKEDFKNRIKGCVVQHHGKLEYGSPKLPNTEEAFMVHYADYIDATMNKVSQVKDITKLNTWADYDRRIGVSLYV